MTKDELSAIQKRNEARTPGPYCYTRGDGPFGRSDEFVVLVSTEHARTRNYYSSERTYTQDDAEFLASASTDIPALLDHIKELEYALELYHNPPVQHEDIR